MFAAALFVVLQAAPAVAAAECRDGQLSIVTTVRELLLRGDDGRARQALESLPAGSDACTPLHLTRLAVLGWLEARDLAAVGGAAERLGPVRSTLDRLALVRIQPPPQTSPAVPGSNSSPVPAAPANASPAGPEVLNLQVEYAATLIRAAIAAAQDERPEMELLLDHARDLVQRIELRGQRAIWPRPFNLAAGELWLEVDRFEESRAAYARAVQADPSSAAHIGLARALARLGRLEQACEAYKLAKDPSSDLRAIAKKELARCR